MLEPATKQKSFSNQSDLKQDSTPNQFLKPEAPKFAQW
jgi:hypothetical protein